jgi:hypothetical protein
MATAGKNENPVSTQGVQGQGGMQGGVQDQGSTSIGSPITNEAYNVITALQAKLEGLEAYRKYAKDGQTQIWQTLTQTDVKTVGILIDELERLVKDGKLRMREPGKGNA